MLRLTSQLCMVAIGLPFSLPGQQARLTDVETTGSGYKRDHFSYFDSLLSEVRTYDKDDKIVKRVIFSYDESNVPVGATVSEGGHPDSPDGYRDRDQEWFIRYAHGQVAEISLAGINTPQGYTFSYGKLGEVKSIRLIGKVKGTWDYVFDHGNLSSIFFNMPQDFPLTARNKKYTAYDNRVNYWRLTNKFMGRHKAILATFFGDDCWSLNNPVQYSMDHKEGERVTQFNYAYDGSGNPVRIIMSATGETDTILKLTYTSK